MSRDLVKQVIVVRKDLNMPSGKMSAQVAHASMAFLSRGLKHNSGFVSDDPWSKANWLNSNSSKPSSVEIRSIEVDEELAAWLDGPFTKVVVAVNSEEELQAVYDKALASGCRASLIVDEGRTVFDGVPTKTCVAIGPNYIERVNSVTGRLPLYR